MAPCAKFDHLARTGAARAHPAAILNRRKAARKKIKPCSTLSHRGLIVEREKAMRKARNILALILRFISAEPVFSTHSRFVV
jgi:hypothetical protein